MRRMNPWITRTGISLLLLVGGCSALPVDVPAGEVCASKRFALVDDFAGARRGTCTFESRRYARVEITREHERVINPSPWFAMRVEPSKPGRATIELDYGDWQHRYVPKVSSDGRTWTALPATDVKVSMDGSSARVRLQLGDEPLWLAAQELLLPGDYDAWLQRLSDSDGVELVEFGTSAQGRTLQMLDGGGDAREVVLLTGRQHPPEVSGAIAMQAFVDTVFAGTPLADRFRDRYRVIAIPLLNPDGVVHGHWRGNVTGADLNRDWVPFEEPETREVLELLDTLEAEGRTVAFFVDFHSTKRNLFYTQAAEESPRNARLIEHWFERVQQRYPDYVFTNDAGPTSAAAIGKNYMVRRYGVPSMTYEVGDETDREVAVQAARVFAEEMMTLLLEGVSDTQ